MTIRRTLLVYFLLMGLAPAAILTGLAFFQARDALRLEITRNLKTEASALMEQIDRMMFDRVLHVHIWSELEIMQEVRVGDVDKRLSHLLFDLNKHYEGVYKVLYCSNPSGDIVAASDPRRVGSRLGERPIWLTAPLALGETLLSPLELGPTDATIEMSASIHDPQGQGETGKFHALFDWGEVFRLLDQPIKKADAGSYLAVLFDAQGRIIAASTPLRDRGLLLTDKLASWRTEALNGVVIADREKLLGFGEVLAGSANSKGYQRFPGFGWSVQVYQPTAQAFAPVDRMAGAFFLLLVLTSAVAVILSLLIAGGIARPIVQLTTLTRNFTLKQQLAEPLNIGNGEVGELTRAFVQMIGELEKSRENLVRAAKLAVVGEMAAAMAHEVRTPLGIMRSSAQMLQREPHLSETGKEMLVFMLSETDRLNNLISALLDCARPRAPHFNPHCLHHIIQRVLDLLAMQANKKSIHFISLFHAKNDLLSCDEEQIIQVLLNLVMNALQILPPGGEITLATLNTEAGLVLNVDDNGPGIAPSQRLRVFDPFYTQREGGIGLGLAVVQQIIKAHDADISVGVSPSGGARFRILFPNPVNSSDL
ncbi:MAG: ATP-binding protein [Methylococcaceae bacterium]|nr:ATP-binding protein [Methylococcaceae bacterium]